MREQYETRNEGTGAAAFMNCVAEAAAEIETQVPSGSWNRLIVMRLGVTCVQSDGPRRVEGSEYTRYENCCGDLIDQQRFRRKQRHILP